MVTPLDEEKRKQRRDLLEEKVAQAIYKVAVDRARDIIDTVPFEVEELPQLFERLKSETETAQVLIFGSYLEDRIEALFKARLFHLDSSKTENAVFGGHGPLDTFGNRVTLAYHLGWLRPEQRQKLTAFQKIRNAFAHKAFRVRFSDPDIANRLDFISYDLENMVNAMRSSLADEERDIIPTYDKITTEHRYLCNFVMLFWHTVKDFLVLPAALVNQVEPAHVVGGFDDAPKVLKKINLVVADAILYIIGDDKVLNDV